MVLQSEGGPRGAESPRDPPPHRRPRRHRRRGSGGPVLSSPRAAADDGGYDDDEQNFDKFFPRPPSSPRDPDLNLRDVDAALGEEVPGALRSAEEDLPREEAGAVAADAGTSLASGEGGGGGGRRRPRRAGRGGRGGGFRRRRGR